MEKEMPKWQIYIIGIILGFLPQIANYVVTKFVSSTLGFDGIGIIGILTSMVLFCIWGIILILFIILSFKNRYLFLGICTAIIIVLSTIYLLEKSYIIIENIKKEKVINYLKEKYNEDFEISNEKIKSNTDFYKIVYKYFFPQFIEIKKYYSFNLYNKQNNNFKLIVNIFNNKNIEKIVDEEYSYKKPLDILYKKINKILEKNGFTAKSGMKEYKNEFSIIKLEKIDFDKEKIWLSFDVYYNLKKDEFHKLSDSLYNIYNEIKNTTNENIEIRVGIMKNGEQPKDDKYKPQNNEYLISIFIQKRMLSYSNDYEGDIIENKDEFNLEIRKNYSDTILGTEDEKKKIIEELFEKGVNREYSTKIEYAIKYCLNEYLKELIKKGENLNPRNRLEEFPLAMALDENNNEAVKILLEAGTTVNIKDGRREPVQIAFDNYINNFTQENLNIFKEIVERGADLNYVNKNNRESILARCKDKNLIEVIEYLKKYRCEEKRFDVIKYIIK